jgi:hypothetical protein
LKKLLLITSLSLFFQSSIVLAQSKLIDYFGLFRVNTSDNRMSGNALKNDSTSERRGAGGDFVFDLGINVQPNEYFKVSTILRSATTIGENNGNTIIVGGQLSNMGIALIFRQVRLEGLIKDVVRYQVGDIDVKLTPYTLYNSNNGVFNEYESEIYKQRRTLLEYENFNVGNTWRMQGANMQVNLGIGNAVENLGINLIGTRVRPADLVNQADRFIIGTGLDLKQSKYLRVGVNWVNMFDNVGSTPDTIEQFNNHVLSGKYDLTYELEKFKFSIGGESGISSNKYFIETINTTSLKKDFFFDIGVNVQYKPLGLSLKGALINVGADFKSPGAQTLRIRHDVTPVFFPAMQNNTVARDITLMDRLTGIEQYNQSLRTGLMFFLPVFGNVLPYGVATPNRRGFNFELEKTKPEAALTVRLGGAMLSEIDGEGTTELRKFVQIKGGTLFDLGKTVGFKKAWNFSLGTRYELTSREGIAPVDFKTILIDGGTNIELIKNFDLLFGGKYLIGVGTEALARRDAFNNIIGFDPYIIDMDQVIISGGARARFFGNSFISLEYNRFIFSDIEDDSNNYKWGNLFLNFWLKF